MEQAVSETYDKFKVASKDLYNNLSQIHVTDANNPVTETHAIFVLIFACVSILTCCGTTSYCVRVARDSNIMVNGMNIRRKYHRNMQLYMLIKEKMMLEKRAEKVARGISNSTLNET